MWKYVLKRIALAVVTLMIILSLTFILIKLLPYTKIPGTDAERYSYCMREVHLGYLIRLDAPSSKYGEVILKYNVEATGQTYYFYQVPVFEQYFMWVKNIFTKWDWGQSIKVSPGLNATTIIAKKLPYSIKINIVSTLVSVPLGIALGIWAALKKNKPTDHIISTTVMICISIPSFVLITVLMLVFCYNLKWLPTQWPDVVYASTRDKILGYIIPVVCLSFGSICGYCRFTRAELCEVMDSEYLLLARTKGLTKKQAIMRHALRNAMVPIVPSILAEFIGILGGSMILENLYGIPGIGKLFVEALNFKDYNVLFVDMAIYTAIGLIAAIFLDISYGFIDPRIRMGAKK